MKVNNPITPIKIALHNCKKMFPVGTKFSWNSKYNDDNLITVTGNEFRIGENNTIQVLAVETYKGKVNEKRLMDVWDDNWQPKYPYIITDESN